MSDSLLVCWVGGADLDAAEGRAKNKGSKGPVRSTLEHRDFQQAHLLFNYPEERVRNYAEWLGQHVETEIHLHKASIQTPVHFGDIYKAASGLLDQLLVEHDQEDLTIQISPGTPAMQAVWILMCKTTYAVAMLQSSEEQGVAEVDIPFDISAEFLPHLLAETDETLRRLSGGDTAIPPAFENIITQSPLMIAQIKRAQKIAQRDIPVLILGESGTGKELFARAIHLASDRREHNRGRPITVNCGAIAPNLVDSLLFGYAKGAFSGAEKKTDGFFQAAHGGTIFLDEFGELPPETQVRLLRVAEDGRFSRVGETIEQEVDVRIIAATNRDLPREIAAGNFREDLFYRIAVGILHLPPLRVRQGDLTLLTDMLLQGINEKAEGRVPGYTHKKLSPKARNIINRHDWPGNIRELQATLTRASVWSDGATISEREMREALLERPAKPGDLLGLELNDSFDIHVLIRELKRHYIQRALAETGGTKKKAAELLGLNNYQTLNTWMQDVGVKD